MRTLIFKLIGIITLVAALATGWLWMDINSYMGKPLQLDKDGHLYEIKAGGSLTGTVKSLAGKGIISKPRYVLWYAKLSGRASRIHAGEYRLEEGMTAADFLQQLFSGRVVQYTLTIIEGWNFKQVMSAVNAHPHLKHSLADLDNKTIMQKLGHADLHAEGMFLPDTYYFPKGMTDVAFMQRAMRAMQAYLQAEWENRATGLPLKSSYEALTLASIVEKETGRPDERAQIAGVFVQRLQKRMRLQTDPTVIYGMGERYKGNIRKKDLEQDTPYNTYRRFGLPPTPIAMPGREAIHATLHPDTSGNLYFVSRGDGSHQFSATLKEHNNAVIKYQLKGRKKSFSSYPAPAR